MGDVCVDPRACISFLTELFRGTKEPFELRALPSKARLFTRDSSEVMDFIRTHAGENVYFGCLTRNGGGGKAHCKETPALWVDVDFKTIPEEEAWELIRQFPVPPSIIVASGGGLHVYWLLAPACDAQDPRMEPILRGLAERLGGDRASAELARIMRLPGTLNHKYTSPRLSQVLEAVWDRRYDLADFEQFAEQSRVGYRRRNSHEGGKVHEGERNIFLTSSAGSMRKRGMTEAAILTALSAENTARCNPPLPNAEVAEIAGSIARYPAGTATKTNLGLVKELADAVMQNEHFAQDAGRKLYRFSDGVYKPDGSAHVKRRVKTLLEDWNLTAKWSSARSEEVVEYLRVDAPKLWEQPPLNPVNVKNGLLDVAAVKLLPHSPEHLSSVQLPIDYDPEARCVEWENFVEQVFPKDAHELAWQIIAWLMRQDISLQKAILLLGEGGNGKSTYLTGVTAFLGQANVSAVSLHKLESDRFSVARLVGKLANISPDLPSAHLEGSSVFKAVTGGDTVLAERKYHESFEFVPFVRLVFSANHPPRSSDSSHAFFRRWLVVPFTRTFDGGEEIPRTEMDARLANPRELSGVLNKALVALKQIQECKGLIESASMCVARDEFRKATDPVAVWLDSCTIEKSDVFVTKKDLLAAYNAKSEAAGRPAMTATAFGLALRRLRPELKDGQRTVAGKSEWVWLGLGLRSTED